MLELRRLLEAYDQIDFSQRKSALATVVRVEGSAYRRPGARMLMTDDGRWTGAISGGCLEGDALRKARQVILAGQPRLVTYDTMDDTGATSLGVGLGCNGIIDVFIEPLDERDANNHLAFLRSFVAQDAPELIATVYQAPEGSPVRPGDRLLRRADGTLPQALADAQLQAQVLADAEALLRAGRSEARHYALPGGQADVFVEVLQPAIRLLIFGGGPDAVPVAALAKSLGWHVTVTDDCIAHLAPKRFPGADEVRFIPRQGAAGHLEVRPHTAAVLMSHSYKYDLAILAELLPTELAYLGILGPRKRTEKMLAELAQAGRPVTDAQLARIYSPVGLDLGAEGAEEIAVAVVAEVLAAFRQRPGTFLRDRPVPIHPRT
jgi:xanthine dehydrogenase accessory factor